MLVTLNAGLAFGAIALLTRMTPAIATILEQNEYSLEACETMLAVLAAGRGEPVDAPRSRRFLDAVRRAEANITEAEERPILARIRQHAGGALAGDPSGTAGVVEAILALAAINRNAMLQADLTAQRLGTAGAWGVVFMAVLSFAAGLVFIRFLGGRVLAPLEELRSVVVAAGRGDGFRRCAGADVRGDFRTIFSGVNELLDRIPGGEPTPTQGRSGGEP
jgi:hypothetical protein